MAYKDKAKKNAYQNAWVKKNRAKHNGWVSRRRTKIREWLKEFKKSLACKNCGEKDTRCLDFHHKREKEMAVGTTVNFGWSIQRILSEINKCDVLCSNCHRKEHF